MSRKFLQLFQRLIVNGGEFQDFLQLHFHLVAETIDGAA